MSYSDYRLKARRSLEGKWGIAILVTLIAALLGGLVSSAGANFSTNIDEEEIRNLPESVKSFFNWYMSFASFLAFVQFVFGGVVSLGYASFLLKLHDGQEVEVKDLFSQFHRFKDGFLLALLPNIFIFLWSLLFIIPGIIASYSYAMAPYIMLEHPELSPRECLKASKEMMNGHKGELFILGLTFLGWTLLSLFTLGIGTLWLNPYVNAAHAAFYRDISNTQPKYEVVDNPDSAYEVIE